MKAHDGGLEFGQQRRRLGIERCTARRGWSALRIGAEAFETATSIALPWTPAIGV